MAIDTNNFIKLNSTGVKTATFVEIREALIRKYKDVYGSDIDLSTGTADGVFVNELALIINNICQTVSSLYSNLDVNSASGHYLDILCALSNVYRKSQTHSTASLIVKNESDDTTENFSTLTFVDKSGIEWIYSDSIQFNARETKELQVQCKTLGSIEAPAGWIDKTLNVTTLSVIQEKDAMVGLDEESDLDLRSRRIQSSGAAGITVLESLKGALLNVSGIRDVKIYNNNSNDSYKAQDDTYIDPHSIYVIIRKEEGITVKDETIGKIIHDKLTPGIHTCDYTGSTDVKKSYVYTTKIVEAKQEIYWKEAKAIYPEITFTITPASTFSSAEFDGIASKLISYLNGLSLGYTLTKTELMIEILSADPKFKTASTYSITESDITGEFVNKDTYFYYSDYSWEYISNTNKYTLTLR